jgi:CubicO group peptidase (beta-lactamase class C family)
MKTIGSGWLLGSALLALAACGGPRARPDAPPAAPERLAADSPRSTALGATFIAPAGWSIATRGPVTVLETPEADSRIALVDVRAADADAAVAAAWAAFQPGVPLRPLQSVTPEANKDGWEDLRTYRYRTSPNERRTVMVGAKRHAGVWTLWIYDMFEPTADRRLAQVALILGRLLPRGYQRETFAGRRARAIDGGRLRELTDFIERGRRELGVPGVALGLVQGGQVLFEGGFGARALGEPAPVDADTLFLVASNTKALTTLLLGTLVAEGRLGWDTPVRQVFPAFRLGDPDTTSRVLIKHLVCACTGLPRQDLEWLLQFEGQTPAGALAVLGTMQPTSKFGELYQYSNPLAAAGGYVAAHVIDPGKELGAAYDGAMRARVFGPLGMTATTFDFQRALAGNHARPHAHDVDGKPAPAVLEANRAIVPVRPAGGAWSSARDLLRYVAMELAGGALPDGKRFIAQSVLLDRRAPQVRVGKDLTYGMGLRVDTTHGTPVVRHGGSMIGYQSDMFWLPEHGVGAVLLANADAGRVLLAPFRRKLLEVLFDGRPEADGELATSTRALHQRIATARKQLTVPPDPAASAVLAERYQHPGLGELRVIRAGGTTTFDFGEFQSPTASRRNPDGTTSFVTTAPGVDGMQFLVGQAGGTRTLLARDAQHEYVFREVPRSAGERALLGR